MTNFILTLLFMLSGCTPNQATPDKYKVCEEKCAPNNGTSYVQLFNKELLFFDIETSKIFQCYCNNGAQFMGLNIEEKTK